MCAMIGHSAGGTRRRPSTNTRLPGMAPIRGRHCGNWSGMMQADAFPGYNALYEKGRQPAPVIEAACWAHGRRDFFDFAKLTKGSSENS